MTRFGRESGVLLLALLLPRAEAGQGAGARPADGPLVTTLATAVADYPALVTGVVPITDPARHPELDVDGRPLSAPRHWVSEEGFAVDREACVWDAEGRPVAYRVAVPLGASGMRTGPERELDVHEAVEPGRTSLAAWSNAPEPPRVGLALELSGGGTYRCVLVDRGAETVDSAWIDHVRAWRRLTLVAEDASGDGDSPAGEAPASASGGAAGAEAQPGAANGEHPPAILGVHAYLEQRADGIVVATLRLSNGAVAADGSGAQGTVFFDALRVEPSEGWVVVWDETGGSGVDRRAMLVDRDGTAPLVERALGPFAFDPRRQTVRRFALCRPGAEQRAGLVLRGDGFARAEGPCSYLAGGWGNRAERVPDWNVPPLLAAYRVDRTTGWRAAEVTGRQRLEGVVQHLDGGRPEKARRARAFGLFHPPGAPERGEPGGWLIESSPGAGLVARNWLRRDRLLASLLAERMPLVVDPETGEPWTAGAIAAAHGGHVPYELHLTGGWWYDKHELPWWREAAPIGKPREVPALEGLSRWAPIDVEHYGRAFTTAYAWALMSGEPLAADLVREAAARLEHAWSLEATTPEGDGRKPEGWWMDLTLGARLRAAEAEPGQGLFSTRDLAWAIDGVVAAYRLTPPERAERRAELAEWLAAAARLVVAAQTPSGICNARRARLEDGKWQSSMAPDPFRSGVSHEWRVGQWLEESLRVNACGSLVRHLADLELAGRVRENVERTAATMLAAMDVLDRRVPPKWVAVKPGTSEVMHPPNGGEGFQSQSALWVAGVDPAVIWRMHGDGTAGGYVREICRIAQREAPDMLSHAAAVLAAIAADER